MHSACMYACMHVDAAHKIVLIGNHLAHPFLQWSKELLGSRAGPILKWVCFFSFFNVVPRVCVLSVFLFYECACVCGCSYAIAHAMTGANVHVWVYNRRDCVGDRERQGSTEHKFDHVMGVTVCV